MFLIELTLLAFISLFVFAVMGVVAIIKKRGRKLAFWGFFSSAVVIVVCFSTALFYPAGGDDLENETYLDAAVAGLFGSNLQSIDGFFDVSIDEFDIRLQNAVGYDDLVISVDKTDGCYKYTLPDGWLLLTSEEHGAMKNAYISNANFDLINDAGSLNTYLVFLYLAVYPESIHRDMSIDDEAERIDKLFYSLTSTITKIDSYQLDGVNWGCYVNSNDQFVLTVYPYGASFDLSTVQFASPANPKTTTRSFSREIGSGHYTVGVDIPAGTYKMTAVKGGGNVILNDGSLNEIMGVPSKNDIIDMYVEKLEGVDLPEGTVLTVDGVKLGLSSRDASAEPLKKRGQDITETVTLEANKTYVAGTDFDPGVYCIEAASGGGNVISEDGDAYGINSIIGVSSQNSAGLTDFYEQQFNNVSLPDRTILYVGDVTIKLIPSK